MQYYCDFLQPFKMMGFVLLTVNSAAGLLNCGSWKMRNEHHKFEVTDSDLFTS